MCTCQSLSVPLFSFSKISVSLFCFFLILCDKFSFINMTDRLRHQWGKKTRPFLASWSFFSSFHNQLSKGMTILYTSAYFNSRGYGTFWISCSYIICDKPEFLRTSSYRIDFNTLSFQWSNILSLHVGEIITLVWVLEDTVLVRVVFSRPFKIIRT